MNGHGRAEQLNERGLDRLLHAGVENDYPLLFAHSSRLLAHEPVKPELKPYADELPSTAAGLIVWLAAFNAKD